MTKHPKTESRIKHEFGNNGKTHSHLNLETMMHLEQNTCNLKHLHKNTLDPQGIASNKMTSIMKQVICDQVNIM